MFRWNRLQLTGLCLKSSIFALLVLGLSLPASSQPRPIIKVVTDQGLIDPVPAGGRWGLPNGMLGTQGNPIPLQDINAVSFRIGDRVNPQWAPGSSEVNSANPQTTFPNPRSSPRSCGYYRVNSWWISHATRLPGRLQP